MHPIAVIELLWRSCCASETEKQAGGLTTGLKVRQRTQLLLDHSLLLGSSSEGIHLHAQAIGRLGRLPSMADRTELVAVDSCT